MSFLYILVVFLNNCSSADGLKCILVECSGQETIIGSQCAVLTNEGHAQLSIIYHGSLHGFPNIGICMRDIADVTWWSNL